MENILAIGLIISIVINIKLLFDLNKNKKVQQELEDIATTDPLTRLPNRYKIELVLKEQIHIAKRYKRHLCLVQFELDGFDDVIEKKGVAVSEQILKNLSGIVQHEIRLSDVIGKWGYKEFMIVLPETSMIHSVMLSEKLRQKIEVHPFDDIDNITASFGVTVMYDDDNVNSFVTRVSKAIEKAKEVGDNKIEVL